VEENPSRANVLASVLVVLRDSLDAPVIQGGSSLAQAFDEGLNDLHSDGFDFDTGKNNKSFGPPNTYLIISLLSG
jgi:hypothetical protein